MIKSRFTIFLVVLMIGLAIAPLASAAIVTCGGRDATGKIQECSLRDLIFTVERIINFLLSWAWLVSILFILWAAWEMINAGGNQEGIAKGKETLKNALIGFFLIMAAYLLINLFVGLLTGEGNPREGAFDIIRNFLPKP